MPNRALPAGPVDDPVVDDQHRGGEADDHRHLARAPRRACGRGPGCRPRISGASAASSSSQRRIGKVSKPVQLSSPSPHMPVRPGLSAARRASSVSEYQGRNRMLTISSDRGRRRRSGPGAVQPREVHAGASLSDRSRRARRPITASGAAGAVGDRRRAVGAPTALRAGRPQPHVSSCGRCRSRFRRGSCRPRRRRAARRCRRRRAGCRAPEPPSSRSSPPPPSSVSSSVPPRTASLPAPPRHVVGAAHHGRLSRPPPPRIESASPLPLIVSSPPEPQITSLAPRPWIVSLPPRPTITSALSVPTRLSSPSVPSIVASLPWQVDAAAGSLTVVV